MPCGWRRILPMMDGMLSGRCFLIRSLVRPGHVAKNPLSMAEQKVDLAGNPAVACRKMASF